MRKSAVILISLLLPASAARADDGREVHGRGRALVEPGRSLEPEPILLQDPSGSLRSFDPRTGRYTRVSGPLRSFRNLRSFAANGRIEAVEIDAGEADEDEESDSPSPYRAWRSTREEF